LPFFFIPLIPLYFRYHTMRYEFDEEGISMSWGILFRRQVTLTYARIQDIHLVSNLIERWLGLARVQIQTASGSSTAELTIEGVREFAVVRDYLYSRMRGITSRAPVSGVPGADVMHQIAEEMRVVRELLTKLVEKPR
jgi:putative membrane protein